jgi:hypothetical protein
MKKLFAIVGLVTAFSLSAVAASQAAVTTNVKVPFAQIEFVPCANGGAGELVLVEGTLHILTTFTINDNHVSGKIHFQPQGATGTGLVTGDTYRATGVTQEEFSDNLTNGQFEDTFINNFRIIGPGPDNNLLVHQTVHITINANGDVTAVVDNTSVECR